MYPIFSPRTAGLAAVVAASLILVSQVLQVIIPVLMPESFWYATQSLRMGFALVAMFTLLLALTGLYSRQALAAGRLGFAAYLTASFGTVLVAGDWWYEAFIGPVLREQAPALLETAPNGSILIGATVTAATFAVGWLGFALASFRAGIFPRSSSVLMSIAAVPAILTLVAPFQVPLAVSVGWMGLWLARSSVAGAVPAKGSIQVAA